jgi:hypothetical protein
MANRESNLEKIRDAARTRREERLRRRRVVRVFAGVVAVAALALVVAALLNGGDAGGDNVNLPASMDASEFSGGPRAAVDRTRVDHGDVPYGFETTASYRIKNVGDQVLRIENPEVKVVEGC